MMRRRDFLLLPVMAMAWNQVSAKVENPRIGFVHAGLRQENHTLLVAFRDGLSALGWIDGSNVSAIDHLNQLVANSDYRKYDDGLRMTIDCGRELADTIEAQLVAAAAEGIVVYGLHRQRAALMTCLTPSVYRSDHIHFLDGAAGGYSAAAASMKGKTDRAITNPSAK